MVKQLKQGFKICDVHRRTRGEVIIQFGPNLDYKNRDFLYQKYVIEGLTCQEIADLIFSSRTTVLEYLKEFEIPVRGQGSNQKRKRGLAYGSKVKAREEVEHKR
ncbi:MAG: hypothetical protein ACPGJV_14920 [Bacteriovoracaceae bacterium]